MSQTQDHGPSILVAKDLDSFYGEIQVLKRVSLRLEEGEAVALFGPNGHGKSTLLKVLAGLHPPKSGSVQFRGQELVGLSIDRIVELGLAYIPEARSLFPEMTVLENLKMGAFNRKARPKLSANLDLVFILFPRLAERKDQVASTLSGGEGRMLAVGRGLMTAASVLLIDEPSVGLSPLVKRNVFEAISRIKQETRMSIFLVEQEVELPLRIVDRVYLLRKQEIVFERLTREVDRNEIEAAYF